MRTANSIVGDMVRAFREDRKLSQGDLARRMGISQPHLCNLEAGLKTWSVDMANAAASALGVDVRCLLPKRPHSRTEQAAALPPSA